jgi:ankyrin repeat protein
MKKCFIFLITIIIASNAMGAENNQFAPLFSAKVEIPARFKEARNILFTWLSSGNSANLDAIKKQFDQLSQNIKNDIKKLATIKVDKDGDTLLHNVTEPIQVDILLMLGADIEAKDKLGSTPLIIAAEEHLYPVVKELLTKKAQVNIQNQDGVTALMGAVCCRADIVQLLLDNGANPNMQDMSGWTALTHAVTENNRFSVDKLISAGANVNAKDISGKTILAIAKEQGVNQSIINLLVQAGAHE